MSFRLVPKSLTLNDHECRFSFLWNVGSDSAEITPLGREFQISGAATAKDRWPAQ